MPGTITGKSPDSATRVRQNLADAAEAAPIVVRGATKIYMRTEQRAATLKEGLLRSLARRNSSEVVLALDDVDLTVSRGEALALIGANGSGKTTLLKTIAGISTPTSGSATAAGRVLGMIELGAGFHPDLTGVENIRLQGAIYGLAAGEIEGLIPAILAFAELADFRDMPVKHYSSGMFVRLGFAIAVHTAPDVLLVDEVLSVGDQRFQDRCLAAIRGMLARGVALVLVTHYPEQAERICTRAAWMEAGKIREIGPVARVLADYQREQIARRYGQSEGVMTHATFAVGLPGRFGSGGATIDAVRILRTSGEPAASFRRGEPLRIEIDYHAEAGVDAVDCTIPLDSMEGTVLTLCRAEREGGLSRPDRETRRGMFVMELARPMLLPGMYRMSISISPPGRPSDHYDILYKLFHFTVEAEAGWDVVAPLELSPAIELAGSARAAGGMGD